MSMITNILFQSPLGFLSSKQAEGYDYDAVQASSNPLWGFCSSKLGTCGEILAEAKGSNPLWGFCSSKLLITIGI